MNELLDMTEKTKLRRLPKRGAFDRTTLYRILDEAFICHVGFMVGAQPFVIPTAYARIGDKLCLHGSAASRMLGALETGIEVCVTVTLVDGLVLARSAFHHSINYRSAMIFGTATVVHDAQEKMDALQAFTEHVVPQRWPEVRPPNRKELNATMVLTLPIEEASAKIRTGDPVDDEEDHELDVWAGVLPLSLAIGTPLNDARLKDGITVPAEVRNYKRS